MFRIVLILIVAAAASFRGANAAGITCYIGSSSAVGTNVTIQSCPSGNCATYNGSAMLNGTRINGTIHTCGHNMTGSSTTCGNLTLVNAIGALSGLSGIMCKKLEICSGNQCNSPIACPGNQVYSMCAGCDRTCVNMNQPVVCIQVCQQKCTCPWGLVLNGDMCVNATQCPVAPVMNITCPSVSPNACTNELKSGFICDFIKWRLSLNHWLQKFEQWRVSNGYTSTLPIPSCPNFNVQCNDATKLKYTTDIYRCNIPYCMDGKYKTGPSIQVWREHQKHWNILYTSWTASNTDSCNGHT